MHETIIGDREHQFSRLKSLRWPMYVIVAIAFMFTFFHRAAPAVMGPDLMHDLSMDAVQFGLLGLGFMWAYAVFQAPSGIMVDRFGPRIGLTVILILAAFGCLLFSAAQSFHAALAGRILLGMAVAGFWVSGVKVISAWYSAREYTTMYPVFMSLGALGGVLATMPLQLMMTGFGWRQAIVIIGSFSLVLAVFCAWRLRDKPADVGLPGSHELSGESVPQKAGARPGESAAASLTGLKAIRAVISMPIIWVCGLLAVGLNSSGQSLLVLWNGVYLADVYALEELTISNILMSSSIGLVLGCIGAVWLFKKIGIVSTLFAGTGTFLCIWIYMTLKVDSMSVTELMVINLSLGLTQMLAVTAAFTLVKESVPNAWLGTAMGTVNTFLWVFGSGLFQQIWGFIIEGVSRGARPYPAEAFLAAFCVQLIVLLACFVCGLVIYRKIRKGTLAVKTYSNP